MLWVACDGDVCVFISKKNFIQTWRAEGGVQIRFASGSIRLLQSYLCSHCWHSPCALWQINREFFAFVLNTTNGSHTAFCEGSLLVYLQIIVIFLSVYLFIVAGLLNICGCVSQEWYALATHAFFKPVEKNTLIPAKVMLSTWICSNRHLSTFDLKLICMWRFPS